MVRYYNDSCSYRLPDKRLTARWLRSVAEQEGYALGDVSYIFCSAERLLEMNRQYLGHDYFTDVITFDYGDRTRISDAESLARDTTYISLAARRPIKRNVADYNVLIPFIICLIRRV